MKVDDVKGVVAALLLDQVDDKTGFAYRVGWLVVAVAVVGVVWGDDWVRWLSLFFALLGFVTLAFVFVTKRLAKAIIGRLAPPADLSDIQARYEAAIAEADIPIGPVSFLRLVWRLRRGVGPEVVRLSGIVERLMSESD